MIKRRRRSRERIPLLVAIDGVVVVVVMDDYPFQLRKDTISSVCFGVFRR